MKLTLRPEWRLWPLTSFLGLLDLKTGVTMALLFALLNKVAGIYGLIAVLTGAGGTFPQISLYIYSALALAGLVWGLKIVKAEDPKYTLYFAHLFFADHILSTAWTVFFAVVWWVYTPHDGRRQAHSAAQEEMMKSGHRVGSGSMTEEERVQAAMRIWNKEKGTAALVIALSWLTKIYFALLIYSYASHLRKGSYRSLPRSRHAAASSVSSPFLSSLTNEEEEAEDVHRVSTHPPDSSGHRRSESNFDFVSAPGRPPRAKSGSARFFPTEFDARLQSDKTTVPDRDVEEVLFDEDELGPKMHSKMGTEESTSTSSTNEY